MLLFNVFRRLLSVIMIAGAPVFAAVLELGESELHGKKDQPEAMTFVTRAQLNDSPETVHEKKISDKIKEEIKGKIFELSFVGY